MSVQLNLAGTKPSAIFAQYDPRTSVRAWRNESGEFRQKFMKELGDHNALNRTLDKARINWGKHVTKIIHQYNRAEWLKEEHGIEIDKSLAAEFKVIIKDYQTESEYITPIPTPARPVDTTQVAQNKKALKRKKDTVVEEAIVAIEVVPQPVVEAVPAEQPTAPATTEVPKRKLVLKLKSSAPAHAPAPAPEKRKLRLVLKNQPSQ